MPNDALRTTAARLGIAFAVLILGFVAWTAASSWRTRTRTAEARALQLEANRLLEEWRHSGATLGEPDNYPTASGLPALGAEDRAWTAPGITLETVGPEPRVRRHDPGYMEVVVGATESTDVRAPPQPFTPWLRVLVRFAPGSSGPASAWEKRYLTDVESGVWHELWRDQQPEGSFDFGLREPTKRLAVSLHDLSVHVHVGDRERAVRLGPTLTALGRDHDLRVEWLGDDGELLARSATRRVIVDALDPADEAVSRAIAAVRTSRLPLSIGTASVWTTYDAIPPDSVFENVARDAAMLLEQFETTRLRPHLLLTRARALAYHGRVGASLDALESIDPTGVHPLLLEQALRLRAGLLRH